MKRPVYLLLFVLYLISCSNSGKKRMPTQSEVAKYKESLVGIHKEIVKNQTDSIRMYVDSNGWDMHQTPTGLWYSYVSDLPGEMAKTGDEVYLRYQTSLLNGKRCYSSDSLGYKHFVCGRGGIEAGIEEAVLLMSKGDKMRVILPSHLGYGVAGDFDCIPRLSILVCEIEMTELYPQ